MGSSGRRTAEVAFPCLVLAVACGGATIDPTQPKHDAEQQEGAYCPTTLAETNGASCEQEGLMCTQGFDCDGEMQQTVCTCKRAHFECQDPIGLLPPGHAPRCLSNDTSPFYCPASMFLADGLTCNELGESCYYEGVVCANGLTQLNYCECEPDGHGGHTFACHLVSCNNVGEGGGGGVGDDGGFEDSP